MPINESDACPGHVGDTVGLRQRKEVVLSTEEDTGVLAQVPSDQWRAADDHPDDIALEGGPDDDLDDVYADPGEVVELTDEET